MPDEQPTVRRWFVRVWALLPEHWRAAAGKRFRKTTAAMGEYASENIRLSERLDQAPDLAWRAVEGAATEKHSQALLNYTQEEAERVRLEMERRTLDARVRKETADARKAEAEARISEVNEVDARVELTDKLRRIGVIPAWRRDGTMMLVKAPADVDWDSLLSDELIGSQKNRALPEPPDLVEVSAADSIDVSVAEGLAVSAGASRVVAEGVSVTETQGTPGQSLEGSADVTLSVIGVLATGSVGDLHPDEVVDTEADPGTRDE